MVKIYKNTVVILFCSFMLLLTCFGGAFATESCVVMWQDTGDTSTSSAVTSETSNTEAAAEFVYDKVKQCLNFDYTYPCEPVWEEPGPCYSQSYVIWGPSWPSHAFSERVCLDGTYGSEWYDVWLGDEIFTSGTWNVTCGEDSDGDTIPDSVDNCPNNCNSVQTDADLDGIGDVCDSDPGCNSGCGEDPPFCESEC